MHANEAKRCTRSCQPDLYYDDTTMRAKLNLVVDSVLAAVCSIATCVLLLVFAFETKYTPLKCYFEDVTVTRTPLMLWPYEMRYSVNTHYRYDDGDGWKDLQVTRSWDSITHKCMGDEIGCANRSSAFHRVQAYLGSSKVMQAIQHCWLEEKTRWSGPKTITFHNDTDSWLARASAWTETHVSIQTYFALQVVLVLLFWLNWVGWRIWDHAYANLLHGVRHELAQNKAEQCVICAERPRDRIVQPCGHLALCQICGDQLLTCPLCRGNIQSLQRVYHP